MVACLVHWKLSLTSYVVLKKSLPTSEETGWGEAAMSEANAAIESVLSEEQSGEGENLYPIYSTAKG